MCTEPQPSRIDGWPAPLFAICLPLAACSSPAGLVVDYDPSSDEMEQVVADHALKLAMSDPRVRSRFGTTLTRHSSPFLLGITFRSLPAASDGQLRFHFDGPKASGICYVEFQYYWDRANLDLVHLYGPSQGQVIHLVEGPINTNADR